MGIAPPAGITPETLEVWPDMKPALDLFLAMMTQWRRVAAGSKLIMTGLDYSALPAVAAAIGVKVSPVVMADLRILETEFMGAMNG